MSQTIRSGEQLTLDPSDKGVIVFDWDAENLADAVTISTSTFTITTLKQGGTMVLTKDSESIVSGNRKTQLRLLATTATSGDKYQVHNKIVTAESPAQEKERSFFVLVQDK